MITNAANTDLVTNSLATRCTFRMIWRPSPIARGMAPNQSVTSTASATLLASWLPPPSAIASRADFIAGTSLTPSPIIATYAPCAVSASTMTRLCSGVSRPNTLSELDHGGQFGRVIGEVGARDRTTRRLDPGTGGDRRHRHR